MCFIYELPDLSKWETKNVTDMSFLFYDCISLQIFPDISKWETKNVTEMKYMFFRCISIINTPDISKWNIEKVTDKEEILNGFKNINNFPI